MYACYHTNYSQRLIQDRFDHRVVDGDCHRIVALFVFLHNMDLCRSSRNSMVPSFHQLDMYWCYSLHYMRMIQSRFDLHVVALDCYRIDFSFLFLHHMFYCRIHRNPGSPSLHLLDMNLCYSWHLMRMILSSLDHHIVAVDVTCSSSNFCSSTT